jgi:trehalose 6-phosphate phosphatase
MTNPVPMPVAAPTPRFEDVRGRLAQAKHLALFLDFDGTISQIVSNPSEAVLAAEVRPVLTQLARRDDMSVAIVSGRALEDIRSRVPVKRLMYVGNHGLEIEAGEKQFRHPEAEALRPELKCVCLQLQLALSDVEGVEIEQKGLTLSVHYRRVHDQMQDWVRKSVFEVIQRSRCFVPRSGSKVVEVRPALDWNKGDAVEWICREVLPASALPIYIGDDATDEDAFAALPNGITIRVGDPTHTEAQYLLPDVPAVARFLESLDQAKSNGAIANVRGAGR